MRMMLKVKMSGDGVNRAAQDGTLQKTIMETFERLKPEAAYFFTEGGERTAFMVIDLVDSSVLPSIAEPFFSRLNAKVEFSPVMNIEDLKKGLSAIR